MSGYLPSYSQLVSGSVSSTTSATVTLIAAPSEGPICLSSLQLGRTDANSNPIVVTFNDLASTPLVVPSPTSGGGIRDVVFDAPLLWPNQTAVTFQTSLGVTTLFASAQGFLKN